MCELPNENQILQIIDEIISGECKTTELDLILNNELKSFRENNVVHSEFSIYTNRRIIGKFIIFIKKVIRKIFRWYINPIVEQQNKVNTINYSILYNMYSYIQKNKNELEDITARTKLLEDSVRELEHLLNENVNSNSKIAEHLSNINNNIDKTKLEFSSRLEKQKEQMEKENEQIRRENESYSAKLLNQIEFAKEFYNKTELRLLRAETKLSNMKDQTFLKENYRKADIRFKEKEIEANVPEIDYFLFEDKFRGSREYIRKQQGLYLDIFKECKEVLDIGCGRGEFVELLSEHGIKVKGIDISKDFVDLCVHLGLNVELVDMFEYLENLEDSSLGGIFCGQVVEHLSPNDMLRFIKLAQKKLENKAPIVIETINPKNIVAVSNWFYMDISHVRPVHPETLNFILETHGFNKNRIMYLNPNTNFMLPQIKLEEAKEFNEKLGQVNECLFGPQDYAVVAYKMN